jgi:alpha-beta hydrolase superfamily lysophospholipase
LEKTVMSVSYAITLVHGTFAHSAEWTKEGSHLRNIIEKEAGAHTKFYRFTWSGANTRRARLEAGKALSLHLKEVRELLPSARQIIIAHSHGGNIAIYARKLAGIDDVSIVTLNTPFIQVTPREVIPLIDTILKELATGFGTALMIGVFWACALGSIEEYQALVIIGCILGLGWCLKKEIGHWIA